MIKNKVAIIGLGQVGMPLAQAILKKYQVVGYDIKSKKAAIKISTNPDIIKNSKYMIVCVPTPVKNKILPDLSAIKSASQTIAKYLKKGQTIIIESTVYPGVCEEIILPILEKTGLKGGKDFELSHCPERINPGDKKWKITNIPRNIGSLTKKGLKKSANFYRSFIKAKINETSSIKIAEASKVIENTFRDINIAYVNELAKSFDTLGIDLLETIEAASNKPFGFLPHYPGCGVGGHCIPVDPYYLIAKAKKLGFKHTFLKNARKINESMPKYTVDLLKNKTSIKNLKIGLLGISYKANVADTRNSPGLKILEILKKSGAKVAIFDPYFPNLSTEKSLNELLQKSEAVILSTNHNQFQKITGKLLKKYHIKIVIDGKNCLNKEEIKHNEIIYKGIGH